MATRATRGPKGRGEAAARATCRKAPSLESEGRARAERTKNIHRMSVTLDVSRLSDWLNEDANCRVKREAEEEDKMQAIEERAWRREAAAVQAACR